MAVEEFKSRFAKVLASYFLPESKVIKSKRILGLLEGKAKVIFKKDFKMSEEEFCQLK